MPVERGSSCNFVDQEQHEAKVPISGMSAVCCNHTCIYTAVTAHQEYTIGVLLLVVVLVANMMMI